MRRRFCHQGPQSWSALPPCPFHHRHPAEGPLECQRTCRSCFSRCDWLWAYAVLLLWLLFHALCNSMTFASTIFDWAFGSQSKRRCRHLYKESLAFVSLTFNTRMPSDRCQRHSPQEHKFKTETSRLCAWFCWKNTNGFEYFDVFWVCGSSFIQETYFIPIWQSLLFHSNRRKISHQFFSHGERGTGNGWTWIYAGVWCRYRACKDNPTLRCHLVEGIFDWSDLIWCFNPASDFDMTDY